MKVCLLTEYDDFDDFCCHSNGVLYLQHVASSVINGGLTNDKACVFAIAVNLDAIKGVLEFVATKEPRALSLRFGLNGDVEVNGFTTVHMDDLLRNACHVDGRHNWNTNNNVCKILLSFHRFNESSTAV